MGLRAHIVTDNGLSQDFQASKTIANFWIDLHFYCSPYPDGLADERRAWFAQLEEPDAPPLAAISAVFNRSAWHEGAVYGPDDYAVFAENGHFLPEMRTPEGFKQFLRDYEASFAPIDAFINDVSRLLERVSRVQPVPGADGWYPLDSVIEGLRTMLEALHTVRQRGAQTACLMIS